MNILKKLADTTDRWLCLHVKPWWLRLWWHRLWLRKDASHPSLADDFYIIGSVLSSKHTYWEDDERLYLLRRELALRRKRVNELTLPVRASQIPH